MHQKEITKELRYIITDVDKMLYNTDWERLDKYRNSIEFLIKRIANDERRKTNFLQVFPEMEDWWNICKEAEALI